MSQDENIQRWSMIAIAAFCGTVFLCSIFNMWHVGLSGFGWKEYIYPIVLGSIAAGGAFVAAKNLNL